MNHPSVDKLLARLHGGRGVEQRTEEWYKARQQLELTASEIASALNIKPYPSYKGSPRAELIKNKLQNKPFLSPHCIHGVLHEDEARKLVESLLGDEILDFGLVIHPIHKWLGASPDGITRLSGRCVELKCPLSREFSIGKVPAHYYPQIALQMEVLGLDSAVFAEYKPKHLRHYNSPEEMNVIVVDRDPLWLDSVMSSLMEYRDELKKARFCYVAPPPPAPPSCYIREDLYSRGQNFCHTICTRLNGFRLPH
jgi:putative phage-type endonuclease